MIELRLRSPRPAASHLNWGWGPVTSDTLKWVMADAAWKVSASVKNIASIRAGKCKMVQSP